MAKLKNLEDVLIDELKDLHSAEKQLLKALPKMQKKASNELLKEAFTAHLEETKGHVERLDRISEIVDKKLTGKTCKAMKGLIEEGEEILEEESDNDALIDILLVGAAQRVEHYEIAAYGTTRAIARELGLDEVVELLQATLDEEGAADKKLTAISKKEILRDANCEPEEDSKPAKSKSGQTSSKKDRGSNGATRAMAIVGLSILSTAAFMNDVSADPTQNRASMHNQKKIDADNTEINVRDKNSPTLTADDQSQDSNDIKVLAAVRSAIVEDENLSMDAHNVKIILKNGKVTLRGPVDSVKESAVIEQITKEVAPSFQVENYLEVAK